MSWDMQYIVDGLINKTAKIGPSGLDYSQFTPCTGNDDCPTCKHISAVMSENLDPETGVVIDKDSHDIHKMQLNRHKIDIPAAAKSLEDRK
jgi:hypothetical protein